MNVEDKASLYDALSAASKIERFVQHVDWSEFQAHRLKIHEYAPLLDRW
jgi:uncharacterized protein with HEPN domain